MKGFILAAALSLGLCGAATASYIANKAPAEIMPSLPGVELPEWWDRAFSAKRAFRYDGDGEREQVMAWALMYMISTESGPSMADSPEGWLHRAKKSADVHEALTWYRKAAESGLPEAQAGLAALHLSGAAVRRDLVRAQMWLTVAAGAIATDRSREDLHFYVQWLRDHIAERLSSEQLSEAERLARDWKPANN